jgi:hypothetical protein
MIQVQRTVAGKLLPRFVWYLGGYRVDPLKDRQTPSLRLARQSFGKLKNFLLLPAAMS